MHSLSTSFQDLNQNGLQFVQIDRLVCFEKSELINKCKVTLICGQMVFVQTFGWNFWHIVVLIQPCSLCSLQESAPSSGYILFPCLLSSTLITKQTMDDNLPGWTRHGKSWDPGIQEKNPKRCQFSGQYFLLLLMIPSYRWYSSGEWLTLLPTTVKAPLPSAAAFCCPSFFLRLLK